MWEGIITRLSPSISKKTILSLFKDSIISGMDNGVMTIGFPTPIILEVIKDKHMAALTTTIRGLIKDVKEVKLELIGSLIDQDHPHKVNVKVLNSIKDGGGDIRKVPNKDEVFVVDGIKSKMFKNRYSLHSFIPGKDNRLAHAAAQAVSMKPGDIYNPLFLYGGVGLGKTHLLQGIGTEIRKNHPKKNVIYMTSEKFVREIVAAIGKRNTKQFKERYRNVDCLIVDDVQFFRKADMSQEEFFHTFNELYDAGKQIVLSSDRPPKELDGLEERLKSRFSMGMVVELQLPDFETRVAILTEKCKELEVMLDPEILEFIAYNVNHSVRELVGILTNTVADAMLTETTPTITSVAKMIRSLYKDHEFEGLDTDIDKRIVVKTIDDLIDLVAQYFNLTKTELVGEDRRKEVMVPRQICMYLVRDILDESYESIGESFGGRNHTTVLHACNKIGGELAEDGRVKRDINALRREIGLL